MAIKQNSTPATVATSTYSNNPTKGFVQYGHDLIDNIRNSSDIVEYVGRYVQLKKRGGNWTGLCPFHNEKTPSFSVSESKQFYHCFGCGASGDIFRFAMQHNGLSFREAVQDVAQHAGVVLPDSAHHQGPHPHQALFDANALAAKYYMHSLVHTPEAIAYLKTRKLPASVANRFIVGYAPDGWNNLREAFGGNYSKDAILQAGLVQEKNDRRYDFFRDRLRFGIRDTEGHIVGFGGRAMPEKDPSVEPAKDQDSAATKSVQDGKSTPIVQSTSTRPAPRPAPAARSRLRPSVGIQAAHPALDELPPQTVQANTTQKTYVAPQKYLNTQQTEAFNKKQILFGLYEAKRAIRQSSTAIVVEGYMDAVALSMAGIENVVATMGTACTREHIETLMRFANHIIFAFDGDKAGLAAAHKTIPSALAVSNDEKAVSFLLLPDGLDPDEYVHEHGVSAFLSLTESASPLSAFLLQTRASKYGLDKEGHSPEQRASFAAEAMKMIGALPHGSSLYRILRTEIARLAQTNTDTVVQINRQSMQAARGNKRQGNAWTKLQQAIEELPELANAQAESLLSALNAQQLEAFFANQFDVLPGAEMWRSLAACVRQNGQVSTLTEQEAQAPSVERRDLLQLYTGLLNGAQAQVKKLLKQHHKQEMKARLERGEISSDEYIQALQDVPEHQDASANPNHE